MSKIEILIVDDKIENRYLLEQLLQGSGYITTSAANGAAALESAINHPPDMIITDILMPVMDGFMLCREWKKNDVLKNIPFIFYTATYTDAKDEEFALSLGADRFIIKPQEPKTFLDILKEIFAEYKAGRLRPVSNLEFDEGVFLKEYNAALVRKLEDKIIQSHEAKEKLRQYADELEIKIEERKTAEQALEEREQFLDNIVENIPDMIFVKDAKDLRFMRFNKASETLLGYSRENMLGKSDHDFFPKAEADFFIQTDKEVLDKKQLTDIPQEKIKTRNKGERILHTKKIPILDETGTPRYLLGISEDITDRKKSEENLRASYDKLRRTLEEIVNALASALEARDPYTAGHERRDAQLACAIAEELGLPEDQIEGLRIAALLHDIGKISVPAEILSKPTKLTALEYELIKVHPEVGYNILKDIEFPWPVAQIVYQHQERSDGSGYPRGLRGDEILIEARILAVADVVEAMASHRPYRPAVGIEEALEEVKKNKGVLYDSKVVDACLRLFAEKRFFFSP